MNPFINNALVNKLSNNKKSFPIPETTVITNDSLTGFSEQKRIIKKSKLYIKEDYVKLFIHHIKDGLNIDISPTGHKLWMMLMLSYFDKDGDKVMYHYDDEICGQKMSRATYYKAVKELIGLEIIAKDEKFNFVYYVNPMYFYRGNTYNILEKAKLK